MKFKKLLIILLALLTAIGLFACGTPKPDDKKNGIEVPTLADLIDYSSNTKYHTVTPVTYTDTNVQKNLLQARIDEKATEEDPSVPVKIFINSSPDEIIEAMSQAALSKEKMVKTVKYLAGAEGDDINIDNIVATGNWLDDDDWSFFDDWDYYEKLEDRADASESTDKDSDNFQRQKRKMMRQVFEIGLTGDEFARLVYHELKYAQKVTTDMHLDNTEWQNKGYDGYVKAELSFDTLVYFKAFDEFSTSKPKTVQLYGYYYDYEKKMYDTTNDDTFEKQLKYSHQSEFTDPEFLEYIDIQRNSYINAYRYKDSFYRKFYDVHFQFQGLLEGHDISVYEISTAIQGAESLRYSDEMKRGMDAGFTQQLILTDHLYVYSGDKAVMKAYNSANTAYEKVRKTGAEYVRDEKEMLLNLEQLKIVDYVLTKMNDSQLSKVLQYHIMTYSGDMIRNIQSEQKDRKLEEVTLAGIGGTPIDDQVRKASEVKIGRISAIVAQLRRSYGNAGPEEQYSSATGTNWKGIRPEVEAALDHNYNQYSDGTAKKKAFDDMLIKKIWSCGGADKNDCKVGNGHLHCSEDYDESHQISRFLNEHETVLRYSIGQVEVSLASIPGNHAEASTSYDLSKANNTIGTYTNGNDLEGRSMPDGAVTSNYPNTLDSFKFDSGLTITEAMEESEDTAKKNFLDANAGKISLDDQIYQGGISGTNRKYKYTFEGWYIDIGLKYKIDENEKIRYDMILYPGYSVQVSNVA